FCFRRRRMVGDVVGGTREAVEGEDGRAQLAAHEHRRDGEVLVAMALAGSEGRSPRHASPAMACMRPFHNPPRPRPTSTADWPVTSIYTAGIAGRARPHSGERR